MNLLIELFLNSYWAAVTFSSRLESASLREGETPFDRLNPERHQTNAVNEFTEYQLALQRLLRRFPYWAKGHLLYARATVQSRNYEAALGSALALKKLKKYIDESELILAQCYLRTGQVEEALSILQSLADSVGESLRIAVLEELAASLLFVERYGEALSALELIPAEKRSAGNAGAIMYAQAKLQEQS